MNSRISHAQIDRINAAQDRWIARKVRRNPRLLKIAHQNLARWIQHDGKQVRPVFREWERILTRLDADEIARFLQSDTPMARRLRQSSPFAGVLSDAERRAIRLKHEKTRT